MLVSYWCQHRLCSQWARTEQSVLKAGSRLLFLWFHTDTSSASEDEGSLRRQAALSAALQQSLQNAESWINRSIQGSSTSSSASSTLSHGEVKGTSGSLADVFANTRIGRSWSTQEAHLMFHMAPQYPGNSLWLMVLGFQCGLKYRITENSSWDREGSSSYIFVIGVIGIINTIDTNVAHLKPYLFL